MRARISGLDVKQIGVDLAAIQYAVEELPLIRRQVERKGGVQLDGRDALKQQIEDVENGDDEIRHSSMRSAAGAASRT